jgi:hypothetical protein
MVYVSVSSTSVHALERRCDQKKIRVKRPTSCYRVNKLILGFLVLGLAGCWVNFRRDPVGGRKAHVFLRIPAAFGWYSGDEKMKDVCYFVHLLCLSFAFTGLVGAVFARCWTRDFAEDVWSISGGCVADVWWWAVVPVNKKPAWRSWTGRLIEVLRFNTNGMLSVNTIYVHAVKQPMYCRKGDKKLS